MFALTLKTLWILKVSPGTFCAPFSLLSPPPSTRSTPTPPSSCWIGFIHVDTKREHHFASDIFQTFLTNFALDYQKRSQNDFGKSKLVCWSNLVLEKNNEINEKFCTITKRIFKIMTNFFCKLVTNSEIVLWNCSKLWRFWISINVPKTWLFSLSSVYCPCLFRDIFQCRFLSLGGAPKPKK